MDGSEGGDEIHCLKAGEVATLAIPAITDGSCKLLQEDEIACAWTLVGTRYFCCIVLVCCANGKQQF